MREKVDDGRREQPERVPGQAEFQRLAAITALEAGNQEPDLGCRTEAGPAKCLKNSNVNEQEFLREAEVLLQQAISAERPARVRQYRVVVVESRGRETFGRKHKWSGVRARGIARQHPDTVVAEHLVQVVNEARAAIQKQPCGR